MKGKIRSTVAVLVACALAGCYHAHVNTGVAPAPAPVHTHWVHGWIYGLVPPRTINATEECNGAPAAAVETQLSFANQLVNYLTLGIYTPMTIAVTCGAGGR